MVGNIHNTRILRFLLVIGAVILTIFIYASYSTSPQLGPSHMHTHLSLAPEALQQQISINNKSGDISISGLIIGNSGTIDSNNNGGGIDKHQTNVHQGSKRKIYYSNNMIDGGNPLKKQHRQPTVDIDAGGSDIPSNNPIDDGPADEAALDRLVSNYFLEEQYLSNVDNAMGNINNSSSVTMGGEGGGTGPNTSKISEIKQNNDPNHHQSQNQDNLKKENNNNISNSKTPNKVLESDVLIPTSNLQKFIENADKILKNMTSNSIVAPQQQLQQLQQQQQQKAEEIKPENVKKPQDQENKDGDLKKGIDVDKGVGNIEDVVDDDYDESQQNSVIMTIKSASKVVMANEEKNEKKDERKVEEDKQKLDLEKIKGSMMKPEEYKDQKKSNELQNKQVTQTSISGPAVASKIAIEQSQNQNNGGRDGGGGSAAGSASLAQNSVNKVETKEKATADPIQSSPAQANVLQTSSKAIVGGSVISSKNATNQLANKPIDASQGIPTMQLYESGHLDEELNIERICPQQGADLKLLILITSAQSHQEARLAVRQTWGHYGSRRDVSTAFILGRSANRTLNLALTQENFIYGDLIRGNFIDSYNNLTLKTISSLEWVDKHCPRAKFILKTDDDMFINVPKLLQFLDGHSKDKRTIFGRLAKKWKPVRNKKSKYYVSTTQFSATVFPSFTTGPAYVLTSDIIHDLYERSLQQVYFKLEDVFTTGIVAQQLNIKRIHVNEFLNRRIAFNPCNIRKTISVHMIKANEQFDLWKKLLDQTTKCK